MRYADCEFPKVARTLSTERRKSTNTCTFCILGNSRGSFHLVQSYGTPRNRKKKDFLSFCTLNKLYLERNPENKDAMILLGEVYFSENDLEKSRELFKKLENETENAVVNSYLGLFKMDDGKYEDAINYFHKAMKLDERNSKYVYNLANAYFLNGWIAEAAKFYNIAICLDADNVDYRYSLAYLYTQTREYDKAEKELRTIFEKDSNHLQARILSAKIKDLNFVYL